VHQVSEQAKLLHCLAVGTDDFYVLSASLHPPGMSPLIRNLPPGPVGGWTEKP
jgi:hypothetical protein